MNIELRWYYYQTGCDPVLQYRFPIVTHLSDGGTCTTMSEWQRVKVEYGPGYVPGW